MKRTRADIARENGAKSKGPITPEGKAKSSRNAVTHALTAYKAFVLQNENYDDFESLVRDLEALHAPVGQHEQHLVWQITGTIWRERRLWDTETALIDIEMDRQKRKVPILPDGRPDESIRTAYAFEALAEKSKAMSLLLRYQTRMIRTRERALESLRALQKERLSRETEELIVDERTQEKTSNQVSTRSESGGKVGDVRLNDSDEQVNVRRFGPQPAPDCKHLNE